MNLFSGIINKVFGHGPASEEHPATADSGTSLPSPSAAPLVDVSAVFDDLARQQKEKLDWRHSIVDLMKLVGIDSSLNARKQLADELGYSGDKSDSATMNGWLHLEVIQRIAANGGKVPEDLVARGEAERRNSQAR